MMVASEQSVAETLRDAPLFVTGGTGFFGRALLRYWSAQSLSRPQVTVLARNPSGFLQSYPEFRELSWLHFHAGDILDPASFPRTEQYRYVLHAAADSTRGPDLRPLERYEQIVTGTRNILEFARHNGAKRLLLASSGGVYGPQPPEMERISEGYCGMPDPLVPGNAYSVAKRAAEHLCILYQDGFGLEVIVARCFAFVGEDLPLNAHFAIGNFIRDAMRGRDIVIAGDGSPVRSYLDQRDLAVWLLTLLEKGQPGAAYNVGSDMPITIASLAELVRDVIAPSVNVQVLGKQLPHNFRNRYVPDVTRARSQLGLAVSVPLVEAIRHTAARVRERGAGRA